VAHAADYFRMREAETVCRYSVLCCVSVERLERMCVSWSMSFGVQWQRSPLVPEVQHLRVRQMLATPAG
jgi:hypothetical protein